jgi:serine/threonine-protein kinase
LDGRYRLEGVLGDGADATIVAATDLRTGRSVAIKLFHERPLPRIVRESRAAWVAHPNICTIYDVRMEPEIAYVVMERLVGETLAERIAVRGPLPIHDVVGIFDQLASVLSAIHDVGVVHGDIKPANIFLVERRGCAPFLKLFDFGSSVLARLTRLNDRCIGTPAYMAPESARRSPIDGRADIFSFGITLFEALAGRRPFHPRTIAQLMAPREEEVPDVRLHREDVPAALAEIVGRSSALEPERRFQSTHELQQALVEIRPPMSGERPTPRTSDVVPKGSETRIEVPRQRCFYRP